MKKPKTYWCGFENDKPALQKNGFNTDCECGIWPQLFKSRDVAKEFFDDVRKVHIVEVKK